LSRDNARPNQLVSSFSSHSFLDFLRKFPHLIARAGKALYTRFTLPADQTGNNRFLRFLGMLAIFVTGFSIAFLGGVLGTLHSFGMTPLFMTIGIAFAVSSFFNVWLTSYTVTYGSSVNAGLLPKEIQEYQLCKVKYPDHFLFYQVGTDYYLYFQDAVRFSKLVNHPRYTKLFQHASLPTIAVEDLGIKRHPIKRVCVGNEKTLHQFLSRLATIRQEGFVVYKQLPAPTGKGTKADLTHEEDKVNRVNPSFLYHKIGIVGGILALGLTIASPFIFPTISIFYLLFLGLSVSLPTLYYSTRKFMTQSQKVAAFCLVFLVCALIACVANGVDTYSGIQAFSSKHFLLLVALVTGACAAFSNLLQSTKMFYNRYRELRGKNPNDHTRVDEFFNTPFFMTLSLVSKILAVIGAAVIAGLGAHQFGMGFAIFLAVGFTVTNVVSYIVNVHVKRKHKNLATERAVQAGEIKRVTKGNLKSRLFAGFAWFSVPVTAIGDGFNMSGRFVILIALLPFTMPMPLVTALIVFYTVCSGISRTRGKAINTREAYERLVEETYPPPVAVHGAFGGKVEAARLPPAVRKESAGSSESASSVPASPVIRSSSSTSRGSASSGGRSISSRHPLPRTNTPSMWGSAPTSEEALRKQGAGRRGVEPRAVPQPSADGASRGSVPVRQP